LGDSRPPLSAVVIARDAAAQVDACLASIAFADEIVVVDSGSLDDTRERARLHGARVVEQAWLGFGPQKQFAVSQATHDWVLCIDTDERVSDTLRDAILAELRAPRASVYAMPRCNRFMGRWLRHGEGYPDWNVRLFHRRHARWSDDAVHEHVVSGDRVARLRGDLLHESAESLERYLDKQNRYTTLQAERIAASGARPGALATVLRPGFRFFRMYVVRRGFLDGFPGFVHIAIGCWNTFMKHVKARALLADGARGAPRQNASFSSSELERR
jgi:glycosyltransferase involved in cell wall biosynthesis